MQFFGKRANLPVANLALLAALVTLIDENVEDIDSDRWGYWRLPTSTRLLRRPRRSRIRWTNSNTGLLATSAKHGKLCSAR